MSTVYHTFEKRWQQVETRLRVHFSTRGDEDHVSALIAYARQHLISIYETECELLEVSSNAQWVEIALQGVLNINEGHSLFNRRFEIIQKRLHHWARQHFKRDIVEDVVQGAFIKLYEDYERHQREWDTKAESFWVSAGKLAMRSAYRELLSQTHSHRGSSRRAGPHEWVRQFINED